MRHNQLNPHSIGIRRVAPLPSLCLSLLAAVSLLSGSPSPAETLTSQQAEARATKALAIVRGLGIENVKLVGSKDRKVVDVAKSGWRVTHSWEVGPTNPDFSGNADAPKLPQGKVVWLIRLNVYLTTEDAEAALAEVSVDVSHPYATFRKPYEQFSRAPVGRIGQGYNARQPAVMLCGNVMFILDRFQSQTGYTDLTVFWQKAHDASEAMALRLHDALHAKGVCSGAEPEQRLEVEPHWAGPGTKLEVQLLSDAPTPQGRADFGPGIEQYKPPDQIKLPDAGRPRGEVYGLNCYLKVAPEAAPGERDVTITDKDGVKTKGTFAVHPLVVVLDVDGLRPDVLDALLGRDGNGKAPNLMRLFGKAAGRKRLGGLELTAYQNGVTVDRAITTFPSYTFPAQASLVTGAEPGAHGIVGNAFFDRLTGTNYGLDGAEAATHFGEQAMEVYDAGLGSKLLQSRTIYETIGQRNPQFKAFSIFHQFGAGLPDSNWIRGEFVDQIDYVPAFTTHFYDLAAAEQMMKQLERCAPDKGKPLPAGEWPSLIWLYLPGVDHYSHKADGDLVAKQVSQFADKIDPLLKPALDLCDRYPGTIFLLVSDHGHTDTRQARDLGWDEWRTFLKGEGRMWDAGEDVNKCDLVARLNGGLTHVYVNAADFSDADCGAHWPERPPWSKVLPIANTIAGGGDPRHARGVVPQLDLVLVRDAESDGWNGPYRVLTPQGVDTPVKLEKIADYLRRTGNAFGVRLGWQNTPEDIAFLAQRFDDLSSVRSGDILVLPHYPPPAKQRVAGEQYYHTTGGDYASQHGSLSMDDMHMSFAVAQPNCGDPGLLLEVLKRAIEDPARPRVTDVPRVAAALCAERFTPEARLPAGGGPAPAVRTPPAAHTPPTATVPPASATGGAKPPAQVDLDTRHPPQTEAPPDLARLEAGAGRAQVAAEASRLSLQTCEEAQKLSDVGEFRKAEPVWLRAIQADPNSLRAWTGLGRNYLDDERNKEAARIFRVAVRLEPNNARVHLNLALALMEDNKEEALREAEKAKALGDPGADAVIAMIRADE